MTHIRTVPRHVDRKVLAARDKASELARALDALHVDVGIERDGQPVQMRLAAQMHQHILGPIDQVDHVRLEPDRKRHV